MTPLAARVCQGLEWLQRLIRKMDADGELSDDDIVTTLGYLQTIVAAMEYEQACRDEARNVACDKGAARKEC